MKKILNKQKGITLIALIVTIIVLIILAGVAISMLSGDNGIINRASEARITTEIGTFKEQVSLAALNVKAKITSNTVSSGNYIAATSENIEILANGVARDLGITVANKIGTPVEIASVNGIDGLEIAEIVGNGTGINTEGFTVAYTLDANAETAVDGIGHGYIIIWYTSNGLRSSIDTANLKSKYNIAKTIDGDISKSEATLVSVINVENHNSELATFTETGGGIGLTSTTAGSSDITGRTFTANDKLDTKYRLSGSSGTQSEYIVSLEDYSDKEYYDDLSFLTDGNATQVSEDVAKVVLGKDNNNVSNIILYDDFTLEEDEITISDDLIINLNKYNFDFNDAEITTENDLSIVNGTIENFDCYYNGKLNLKDLVGDYVYAEPDETDSDVNIINCNFTHSGFIFGSNSGTTKNINIIKSRFESVDTLEYDPRYQSSGVLTFVFKSDTNVYIKDSYIKEAAKEDVVRCIYNYGRILVDNSTVIADVTGSYGFDDEVVIAGYGIINRGTLVVNSGYVYGVTHGIDNSGNLYIYGGTFEGSDHGGIYFAQKKDFVAYVENAAINGVEYKGEFADNRSTILSRLPEGSHLEEYRSAFYFRGSESDSATEGGITYIVNSTISQENPATIFTLRNGGGGEKLYLSGVRLLNTAANQVIRVDYADNKKIYIGKNCDLGNINTVVRGYTSNGELETMSLAEAVSRQIINYVENADYKDIVQP